ncbi:MAG: amidohydrolase family protein, partial [Candidatus Sumerlaeaceae bacterium]|nr:amidohydrolase family protein [Candidatus Sumerlaeaceae bacterium]
FQDAPGCAPTDFLANEGLLDHCDVGYHLNFPGPDGGAFFAAPRLVVHCPGTHSFFARDPFPLCQILASGANLALGTDSLASSDSLGMFDMLRIMGGEFPCLAGPQLLDMVTTNPARASVLEKAPLPLGIIQRGAAADFTAIEIPGPPVRDLRDLLMEPAAQVSATFIAGDKVY